MKSINITGKRVLQGLLLCLALQACSSAPVMVSPMAPQRFEKLGHAEGQACGALGLLATAYYAVPLGLNSRVERAYDAALKSVPGATSLVNVSVKEDWAWALVVTARCTTVSGDAIKEIK
ncbi:hypothetical protein [Uliginosibacterium gangwonense]|uniref:hypothetical protein n=1 Tax=Uliginosibacterium gangwonense TaxID=392736 RepID=UPI0006841024|nr:hypothetical protein [Uliginosibacterium gangwonense]